MTFDVVRARVDLVLISLLVLFLELACIRWFPAHVLFLTFFTNTVLLASFLGMSVGCLAARRRHNYLAWTPILLAIALGAAHLTEFERQRGAIINVPHEASVQHVFFGVEYQIADPSKFVIPIEVLGGFFFLMIALALVGPGQQLGRALTRLSNRVEAYTLNILGSIAGVMLFAACSRWQFSPAWWFSIVLVLVAYFLRPTDPLRGLALAGASAVVLVLATSTTGLSASSKGLIAEHFWSPYYRVDYEHGPKVITVNLIGHQQMISSGTPFPAYALPHLLNRDVGRPPFSEVLIIGAGSGNDVSRALTWGARHVDAVEIDPVIYRLGTQYHPDRPYDYPRVFVHLDDGRNFLRATQKKYDLVVYALVDSLVLHSSYSNIRLESYLFTKQAFEDVRRRLKPGGLFVMYNYFRHGWIVARLRDTLEEAFGTQNPLVLNLPPRQTVEPDQVMFGEFTVLLAGATRPIRQAFGRSQEYWLQMTVPPGHGTPNGFATPPAGARAAWQGLPERVRRQSGWMQFIPTTVIAPAEPLRLATDDWPFLYLRRPTIPVLNLRGMAIMGTLAVFLILAFLPRRGSESSIERSFADTRGLSFTAQMFFLGAGFMLIETKAVVHMALLFGSTWTVNSVVFVAVLVMILLANLFALVARPRRVTGYYAALLVTLAASAVVPMDFFLGMSRTVQVIGSCVVAFAPILFAGIVFAVAFSRAAEPDRAFGANVAGAMFGGLAEYSSMLLGFQHLLFIALAFYAVSALSARRQLGRLGEAVRPIAPAVST